MRERGGLSRRRQDPDLRAREPAALRHQHLSGPDVLAGRPDVRSGRQAVRDSNGLPLHRAHVERDDRVGPRRNRRSRRDPHGFSPADRGVGRAAGHRPSGYAQRRRSLGGGAVDVCGPYRHPVDFRGGERRDVELRGHVAGQDAAVGLDQRQLERRQGAYRLEHPAPCVIDRDHRRRHGHVPMLPRRMRRIGERARYRSFLRWTKSARNCLNSLPRSSRSAASSTVARR